MTKKQQRGGSAVGFILGVVVGLGAALAVAVYVTKVPVPFLNKGGARGIDQDAVESQRNKNWDPNSPLYGKNPARPAAPAASTPAVAGVVPAPASTPASAASAAVASASSARGAASKPGAAASSADPLGDLARARAAAGGEPFDYFVQAGAFRTQSDADAQRAKLAMLGWEARVSEREQNGRTVFRVRVGPFTKRDDAEMLKEKLDGAGVESALVRVQH
ncbi:SPOR domain-containing protein [Paracidovorax anthurii]|uniref:Sporulation related protein n=1 Tax=Paracidovorax anthurii TaxID=78229 RepID=A0A328YSA3_9BURK|nr:SPOR domain-containing protein [Paracidovorax anthurii]RAR76013.1 sporulation related protein [Paracidovorax anthurii]WCM93577.1 SPOR domain-containing protein [Acidovorax sp. NCPPB 2350]